VGPTERYSRQILDILGFHTAVNCSGLLGVVFYNETEINLEDGEQGCGQ
jgi:hypothetical protein